MKKIPRNYQVAIHDKVDQLVVDIPGTSDASALARLEKSGNARTSTLKKLAEAMDISVEQHLSVKR